jgi:hypothetical protein
MSIGLLINPFESSLMAIGSYYKTIQKQSNMKPFDLEKAKQGHPVQTRDGRDVEILKTDVKSCEPIVAVVKNYDDHEIICKYREHGRYEARDIASCFDLFMKPTKKEGWINVYVREDGIRRGKSIYNSKEKAQQHNFGGIDTVKIEWKE